tara:strand:+ start:382 stop:543 length:162 start_codon:yes stop_codon:yes gene_type:complete
MPKGYIIVSYREAPDEDKLMNYAPMAFEAMTNAGNKLKATAKEIDLFSVTCVC